MDMEHMSVEVAAADTAAEVAAEAAAADPSNRAPKKSSQTCSTCRLRKVRCDGRRDICQNCERLGFSCSFQDTGSPNPDGENVTSFSLPRRRVRLACINCHSRKARCTGETPRPTKRSGGVNGTGHHAHHGTDSEHEGSVTSEPPEKRAMTQKDHHGSHYGRAGGSEQHSLDLSGAPPSRRFSHEPIAFPDESLIHRTFNNFFRHVHHVPMFSFLHRASLMQRYHAGMMDRALLLALVGITSLLTDLGPGVREYGHRCIDECQSMVLQDLENPSTIKIQALVLVMKHRMLSRRFTSAFMLAATAARFAYALRLNYENPNLCFLARESRRRLMWAFLTIDSGINGGYPDFTLLPSESMHIQLPCNERNFEFDLPQVTEHLRPIPTQPFPDDVGSLALHVRLLWMRSRVLYCTKNVLAMPESEALELPQLIKVLSAELSGFNDHLPASFKFSESNLQLRAYSPRLCVFIMIHVWWRQCHCDLYRIVLTGLKEALPRTSVNRLEPQFVSFCARQCFEHALAIAEIFRLILALDGGLPVTDLDLPVCAYQCARMLYFAYQMNNGEIHLTAGQVLEHANRCLQIAKSMNHLPAGAAIVADLEKLISRGLSASTTPSHPASPDLVGQGGISHQMLSRHNPIQQMHLLDDSEVSTMPVPSPSTHTHSPRCNASGGSVLTPASQPTPGPSQQRPRDLPLSEMPFGDPNMPKPNLPPVVPPDGLDNNNAFEGAMDGFDFAFESFGNTGVDSVSWFSNEWLNNEFPPTTV
ncbi:Uu.00g083120.m01.CDS01 [Anthostomella pinea]|uniref:Uu.00g083120.m01.CDS01 n=1 Tax=Anthostomella pinea TaxID=933095 RepID=A0AAI8YJG4_9PEZI|nr:Uu.00g083120.m01.CDS01 [Anthostomella pinea]